MVYCKLNLNELETKLDRRHSLEVGRHRVCEVPKLEIPNETVRSTVATSKRQGISRVDVAGDLHLQTLDVSPAGDSTLLLKGSDDKGEDRTGIAVRVGQTELAGFHARLESHLGWV